MVIQREREIQEIMNNKPKGTGQDISFYRTTR